MLNKRMEQHISQIVGDEEFFRLRKTQGFRQAMKEFDNNIKPGFMATDDYFYMNFPLANLEDDKASNLVDNCLTLNKETLTSIFGPLISEIEKLIDEQCNMVKIKRMQDGHAKADEIKVRATEDQSAALLMYSRLSSLLVDLALVSISSNVSKGHIQIFR
jgi:hypothetical protein